MFIRALLVGRKKAGADRVQVRVGRVICWIVYVNCIHKNQQSQHIQMDLFDVVRAAPPPQNVREPNNPAAPAESAEEKQDAGAVTETTENVVDTSKAKSPSRSPPPAEVSEVFNIGRYRIYPRQLISVITIFLHLQRVNLMKMSWQDPLN